MQVVLKLMVSLVIGIIVGNLIDIFLRRFINETEDRIKDYRLDKKIVIAATVIFTVAVLINLGWIGLIRYGLIGFLLILIGGIDYYTHYVYMVISIPTIALSIVLGMYFNGFNNLFIQVSFFIILYIFARFTSKFYGDIECLIIIGATTGSIGLLVISIIALLISTCEFFRNRKKKNYSVAFCFYFSLAYILSVVFLI